MTALSNSFRIQSHDSEPNNGLNDSYGVTKTGLLTVNTQSTLFKESGNLSYTNRLEIQKIKSFSELEENWDSYEAETISSEVIDKSIDLVKEIDALEEDIYFSSPGPNGEVMIQLNKNEKEVEFIIYKNKSKYVTFENTEFKKQGEFKNNLLPSIIEWVNL